MPDRWARFASGQHSERNFAVIADFASGKALGPRKVRRWRWGLGEPRRAGSFEFRSSFL